MSDAARQGFLDHIIADPDDDSPRLVYADWLEEHGDPDRAEFIRAQVERAKLPAWDAQAVRLRLRERVLLGQHGKRWLAELPDVPGARWDGFRRGFVAGAAFTAFAAFESGVAACRAATPLEAVSVRWPGPRDGVERVAPVPGLRELTVTGRMMDPADADRLAASPLLSTLRALNARECALGPEGFRRLLASPHLGALTTLRVPSNHFGDGAVAALFRAASLTALAELDLSETATRGRYREDPMIQEAGVRALAGWPGLARVRSLTLAGNDVRRGGLNALLRSPHAAGLKELSVRDNQLNGPAVAEFGAANPKLRLDVLDLGDNVLREVGAAYLARAACLRELKVLHLDRCELPPAAGRELAAAPFLAGLRRLNLNHNSLGPKGLAPVLAKSPAELHTLDLVNNGLRDAGAAHLAGSAASDRFVCLDLRSNGFGDAAAGALAGSPHLRDLAALRLGDNPQGKHALDALRRLPLGQRLTVLDTDDGHGEDVPI